MSDPIRERLLAAIVTATAGEYGEYIAVDDELPVTVVADGDDSASTDVYGITSCTVPVTVARAEKAASTDKGARRKQAHLSLAALVVQVFADPTFGALAHRLEYTGCAIQTEGAGGVITVQAYFSATYRHMAGDPFTLPGAFD